MLTITKKLDMSPHGVPQVIRVSQYDSDFTLEFKLFASGGNFAISTGTTAEIRGTKQSGTGYSASATLDTSTKVVTVAGAAQMTAVAGMNIFEIVLKKNNKEISSANFCLLVERAALDADTITDESVLKELNAIIESADTATQAAEEAEDAADRAEAAAQSLVIDSTPTQGSTNAVSSGGVYDAIEDAIEDIETELSEDAKTALLNCFQNVAWTTDQGTTYYEALRKALYPDTGLVRIEAVFNQGTAIIFTDTPLNNLKAYLVVTGYYNDGTSKRTSNYALSGQLVEGTSTITASVGTLTATFTVNVTSSERYEYKLSDGTLAPFGIGSISTVDGIPTINRSATDRRIINIDHGVKPFNIRNSSSDTDIQESIYYPIPIPSDATSATITVTPATLSLNGTIRKYENGVFTIIGEAQTAAGSITFTFEADDNLYFVGQVRDITDTEPTEVVVTFTATEPELYTYKLSDGTLSPTIKGNLTTVDGLINIIKYTAGGEEYNEQVINVNDGVQPYILRDYKTDSEYTISTQYPVKIPSDATSATITVTPATLELNGTIRKYENGAYTTIGSSQTAAGEIQFTFEADEDLYFVGQVKDTDAADITDIIVEFE